MNPATSSDGRILVLEPDEHLASAILDALHEVAPEAVVDLTHSLEEAQRMAMGTKPDLFVLDVDATYDLGQEFLYDLRTSHPDARAIILTAIHLAAARVTVASLGAIHFLEKPFPHGDFVDLVLALLRPSNTSESEKFQGTLSDLHMADIIQLKCMSGATAAIEFTAPSGERGRVYFENGQVRHATAPGKEGTDAFNEIVTWKGGMISEVQADSSPQTINLDWQILLMEAVRKVDEAGATQRVNRAEPKASARRKVLVIDDSLMLLSFVKEILAEFDYDVATASNAAESLAAAKADRPGLILLDYVLPDMKGDEVCRKLLEDHATAKVPVVYMSGFGTDLRFDRAATPNVIGTLNKPFTSDLLIKTVETHMSKSPEEPEPDVPETGSDNAGTESPQPNFPEEATSEPLEQAEPVEQQVAPSDEWWSAPPSQAQETWGQNPFPPSEPVEENPEVNFAPGPTPVAAPAPLAAAPSPMSRAGNADEADWPNETVTGGAYFCGDTSFFPLNWALQTIAKGKLTGTLRCFWSKDPIELLSKEGEVVLATTRDPELYCVEHPITLMNIDQDRIAEAREEQRATTRPMFITLADRGLILQEPALQLVQHFGQKLFSHLWTAPRVRFIFEQSAELPDYAANVAAEADSDHWALATLRLIQFPELGNKADYNPASVPGYTRDGFERVQNLRLTVAEAQFASQFNGVRSIQQIAKNLRLDLKFARLTLFRFLALEIVELWPATAAAKPERKGVLQRITKSIGIGE
jgi:DNA-binding response OmpR family regulator